MGFWSGVLSSYDMIRGIFGVGESERWCIAVDACAMDCVEGGYETGKGLSEVLWVNDQPENMAVALFSSGCIDMMLLSISGSLVY